METRAYIAFEAKDNAVETNPQVFQLIIFLQTIYLFFFVILLKVFNLYWRKID